MYDLLSRIAAFFRATTGSCTTDGTCFQSPNYPADYGSSQTCTIAVDSTALLLVSTFRTENNYDYLTVNGLRFTGTSSPAGQTVNAGTTIQWYSDGSVTDSGFRICSDGTLQSKSSCNTSVLFQKYGKYLATKWKACFVVVLHNVSVAYTCEQYTSR